MPFPPDLTLPQLEASIRYIEREACSPAFQLLYDEQPNVFSAVIGILGTVALDSLSPYEKNPDRNRAASRFPDLIRRGSPRNPTPPGACLECKASKRPWHVDAHYNHEGWYIIWRYLVDPTESLGKRVVIWRVDCAYLTAADWRYVTSRANELRGGRTHTYTVVDPQAVFAEPLFQHPNVVLARGKPVVVGD